MIISKDLFIFGEQIFGNIMPESASSATNSVTQSSAQQQQQQQQQLQQLDNKLQQQQQQQQESNHAKLATALAPAVAATETATMQTTTLMPTIKAKLSKSTSATTAAAAASKATTAVENKANTLQDNVTTTTTTKAAVAANKNCLRKQETIAVVVAAAAAAATVSQAKKVNISKDVAAAAATKRRKPEQQQNKKLAKDAAATELTNVTLPATVTAAAAAAAEEEDANFALQQQQHAEDLPLLAQQQKIRISNDCCLQIDSSDMSTSSSTPSATSNSTLRAGSTNNIVTAVNASSLNSNNSASIDMGKIMLQQSSDGRSDHAMVTLPFISDQHRTLQLIFQNINVVHNDRKILTDVSGLVSPGEVLAIMGPSGSGKTTLLDCLSGQRRADSGNIYLNREPLSKKWRRKICYVLQEEIFFSGLTLKETVMYTAMLRLPEKMPKTEKLKLVENILETLELNFCQQTKFGDYLNRGLSGGEKKRANIACELLTDPLLMLLDEPTSGLDSHSAISLMKILKRYAMQEQKTVVISVHQPSSQMFHMFDKLLLLYNGRTAYFGDVNNIYRYFEDIGVAIKPHYNPADFVLDQLKSDANIREKLFIAAKESQGSFVNRNGSHCQQHQNEHYNHNQHKSHNGLIDNVANTAYITNSVGVNADKINQHDTLINDIIHNYYNDIRGVKRSNSEAAMLKLSNSSCEESAQQLWCGIDSQSNFSSNSSNDSREHHHHHTTNEEWLDYPTCFCTQFQVLSSRNFKEAKPRMLSKLNWFQTVGLALMAGAIWFQIPREEEYLHDLQGWMFFSQTYWMLFALFGALNSFPSEREVISKERRSGAYRLSAYYLAKMCGELPLVITLPTVYLMISYPMLGCTSLKLFFLMLVFLLLNTIVAQSVGFFIGACCMDMNVSITLSALYTLATQLFGGYLSTRIPEGLSWIRYTSMIHYAYQNMQILEFREGTAISCGEPSSFEVCKNSTTTIIPYEEILKAQNSTAPLWLNTLILMMFFLVFRGLGYAVLRYIRCPKT